MDKKGKNKFSGLIDSFFKMDYSPKVRMRFYAWLFSDKDQIEKEKAMLDKFNNYDIPADENVKKSLAQVHDKIGFTDSPKVSGKVKRVSMKSRLIRVAAVVVLLGLILSGVYYLKGDAVTDQSNMLSVSVTDGVMHDVVLPDNSQVWIKSGSSIRYPENNETDTRLVELSGEAYFAVEKNPEKPFIVKTKRLSVTVTGTEFDVKEIPDKDMTIVTLMTGRVNVKTEDGRIFTLEPHQQLIHYNLSGKTEIADLETTKVNNIAIWKNDRLAFENASLEDIIEGIEIYFNVSINSSGLIDKSGTYYTIRFNPGENLESVMRVLKELTGEFDYSINGKNIYMTDRK